MRERTFFAILLVALLFGGFMALYAAAQAPAAVVDREQAARNILLEDPIPDGSSIPTLLFNDADSGSQDDTSDLAYQRSGLRAGPIIKEQGDPPIGITQINSSTVNYVSPDVLAPSTPLDLCFNVTVDSPDVEYMDRFDVDLPDAWTVTTVYVVPPSSTCVTETIAGVEAGNVVYWQLDAPIPSGCGAWNSGIYDFCANISLPDCSGAPWSLPWNIVGDGYGDPPHEVSGIASLYCLAPGLHLWPETLLAEGCHTLVQTHTLNLLNQTGFDGVFTLTYSVPSGNGILDGPDQIYLGDGVDQDLIVELTPTACLAAGELVTATIDAAGIGHSDSSVIVKTIRDWPTCPVCPKSYYFLPIVLKNK